MIKRDAFTLLEVMIVLAIVASLLAIAWPRMRGLAASTQVREAAIDFKAACAEARDQAVRRGVPIVISYQLGRSQYRISESVPQQFDAADMITIEGPGEFGQAPEADRPLNLLHELPAGIAFDDPANRGDPITDGYALDGDARLSDQASNNPEQLASEDKLVIGKTELNGWADSQSITFYPEGRCTSATVRLLAPDFGDSISLTVRGLTSGVVIGPVERAVLRETNELETQPIYDSPAAFDLEAANVSK